MEILRKIAWLFEDLFKWSDKSCSKMRVKFKVDRHFLFLHGQSLTVFAERVLRKSQSSSYIPNPLEMWSALDQSTAALRLILEHSPLKRKERTEAIREKESLVLLALGRMADYVECAASCKSDVFTTGFRPHTEHRKRIEEGMETRRRQRVSAKMVQLEEE